MPADQRKIYDLGAFAEAAQVIPELHYIDSNIPNEAEVARQLRAAFKDCLNRSELQMSPFELSGGAADAPSEVPVANSETR